MFYFAVFFVKFSDIPLVKDKEEMLKK